MSVPSWVYKRMAMGDISSQEVAELEKFASSISQKSVKGAVEVVKDRSNNLDDVMSSSQLSSEDKKGVLAALRKMKQMKKEASDCASGHSKTKKRLKSMKKKAGAPRPRPGFRDVGAIGALMGAAALGPAIGHLAERGINRLAQKSQSEIARDLQRVLEVHPQIGRPDDPRVIMAYNSLVRLNPTYAEDPLIAGPLLKQIVESRMDPTNPMSAPIVDPGIAKNLSEARKAIREGDARNSLGSRFGDSFRGAATDSVYLG